MDGNLAQAMLNPLDVQSLSGTNFQFAWNTVRVDNGIHNLYVLARTTNGRYLFSGDYEALVSNNYVLAADVVDPTGDNYGLHGDLLYPTDPTYSPDLNDLERVQVYVVGGSMRLVFKLSAISIAWNPPLRFDHVSFSVYLDNPDKAGVGFLPRLNAPDAAALGLGFTEWDYKLIAHGWWAKVMSTNSASVSSFGESVGSPAVSVDTNGGLNTVTFDITASMLGYPLSFNGWKIFVTVFDIDGTQNDYRRVAPYAASHAYGTSSLANIVDNSYIHPYIADHVPVITLSNL